jgi:hypothetical protein
MSLSASLPRRIWQVGTSVTLRAGIIFGGNILADQTNTLASGASVIGRVMALNGAVTLDNNCIIPEPTTLSTSNPQLRLRI